MTLRDTFGSGLAVFALGILIRGLTVAFILPRKESLLQEDMNVALWAGFIGEIGQSLIYLGGLLAGRAILIRFQKTREVS